MEFLFESTVIKNIINELSVILELIAVGIIFLTIMVAGFNYLKHFFSHDASQACIDAFKQSIGRGIQIALELLIAADIIHTVVLSANLENVAVLAILVLIRTFLSWTLVYESDGIWPWGNQKKKKKKD